MKHSDTQSRKNEPHPLKLILPCDYELYGKQTTSITVKIKYSTFTSVVRTVSEYASFETAKELNLFVHTDHVGLKHTFVS